MYTSTQLLEKINQYIASLHYTRCPIGLYDPITYVMQAGGKRLRPTLMLLSYQLFRGDVECILPQAAAIEMYHNYTLLHDDLMDCADVRRGRATVHRVWNDNTAILSGDAMLVLSYQLLSDSPHPDLKTVWQIFNQTALEICEGQQLDMEFEVRNDVTEEEYMEMIRLKTSVLLAASLQIGAALAGAPKEQAAQLYKFGENIGLAFQLQDDYLDVYGNPALFGKKIGGDILCNKKTFMLINALRLANDGQRKALEQWVEAKCYHPAEKIAAVTELYNCIGVKALCQAQIAHHFTVAMECLDALSVQADSKRVLWNFVESLVDRNV